MMFKDHANRKSNQQNLGTIKSSNLCCEIIEYTSKDEIAVCNLASICLPKFVKADQTFDHEKLHEISRTVTKNLNRIIDNNYYPIEEAKRSNMRHRPIGIGIQGLADCLIKMKVAFEDDRAEQINADIFETIYHAAMTESIELAKQEGPYETFKGSPLSQGKFQFDLWNVTPASGRYDWDSLRKEVIEHGARNSLLVAPMPTASTAQIMSNNESFEPYTTNIYTRRVLSGEFICVNPHLVEDLISLNLWNSETRTRLIADQGSVQNIKNLPQNYKDIYKTIWEISQKKLIKLASARAPYICQS
jgi:ribonucleoside-diphosphate reductase alpha chain